MYNHPDPGFRNGVRIPPVDTSAGVKADDDKQRYDLIPADALAAVVAVLTFGAQKYADRNWEKGLKYGRVFGAAMRHMWAWWRGEETDPETGFSHLAHAACCVLFLLAYTKRKANPLCTLPDDLDDRV